MRFDNSKRYAVDPDIAALERVAALHWRAPEEERLGGWLLRAGRGFTGRANSALAVGDPGVPLDDALAGVDDWYRARGLPSMIAVPLGLSADGEPMPDSLDDYLASRNWAPRPGPAYVMVAGTSAVAQPAPSPAGLEFRLAPEPDAAWLAMYHYRGQELPPAALELLMSAAWQRFASIRDPDGSPVAIARLSVASGWAGITAVEVSAARRRQGLGALITQAACAEAARQGVGRVFLQVETTNAAALALYERCGFRYSHRYHYRVAPRHSSRTPAAG